MKKVLGLIMLTAVFTCCDLGVGESNAGTYNVASNDLMYKITKTKISSGGMDYVTFHMHNGGACSVNITKDKLEVELLELQIKELKNK